MNRNAELSYLKKLKIMLSFFFDEDDIYSIAYDYAERFQIALSNGHASDEVPESLKSPWDECRQIIVETYPSPVKAFFSHKKCKLFLMMLVFVLTTLCVAIWCEKRFVNFCIPALCINFGTFIVGILLDRGSSKIALDFRTFHVFLLGCICTEILVFGLFLPHMKMIHVGELYASAVLVIVLILLIMNVIMFVTVNSVHGLLLVTRHVMAVVLASVYLVSQLHIMQENVSLFLISAIIGALCIYFESIILDILRSIINRFWSRNPWTHS